MRRPEVGSSTLDALVASRDGDALPDFDDYYPGQKACYEDLA